MPGMAKRPSIQFPQRLKSGDAVRLITPASPYDRAKMRAGIKVLQSLGFEVLVDEGRMLSSAGRRYLAHDDTTRASLLNEALAEKESRAVWSVRGGYGCARLLARAQFSSVKASPKWLIGFSDLTALHTARYQQAGVPGLHGPVVTQLSRLPKTQLGWLLRVLAGETKGAVLPLGRTRRIREGKTRGRLMGGNLSVLASLAGTPWQPVFRGAIVMLEDVGEWSYRLDRSWTQLVSAGVFRGAKGLVLGEWEGCKPAGRSKHSARRVVEALAGELGLPCVGGAPFGHGRRNLAWPLGLRAELDAGAGTLRLLEDAAR